MCEECEVKQGLIDCLRNDIANLEEDKRELLDSVSSLGDDVARLTNVLNDITDLIHKIL